MDTPSRLTTCVKVWIPKQDNIIGIAAAHAYRGETDQAFAWLERAYQERDIRILGIKTDPYLKSLVADPRYKALLRKMNLPE